MIRGYPSPVPNKEDLTQLQLLIVHKLAQGLRDFEACLILVIVFQGRYSFPHEM